ncbi:MAG: hypothetical protein HY078_08825 [Elusimicrobia bacterium]|nr:hypothetical protein [Elusimicrobiota bacterium]
MKRNLYFYLYPVKGSHWDWHLGQLRRYWSAFNGKKQLVVSLDRQTVRLADVVSRLEGLDPDVYPVENDRARGESRSFVAGLERFRSESPDEITFYAHGKGVTHRGLKSLIMQAWSESMYFMNLSSPGLVEALLKTRSTAGCFRQEYARHGGSDWHYSGTFFWFKHSALFTRDWRRVSRGKYGVEGYPGRHFALRESYCLTPYRHFGQLYDHVVTRAESRRWLAAVEKGRGRARAGAAR